MENKENIIFFAIISILGIIIGAILSSKDIKIEKLQKENEKLNQEIIDYQWQIEQVPYIIESWCKGE